MARSIPGNRLRSRTAHQTSFLNAPLDRCDILKRVKLRSIYSDLSTGFPVDMSDTSSDSLLLRRWESYLFSDEILAGLHVHLWPATKQDLIRVACDVRKAYPSYYAGRKKPHLSRGHI